MSAARHFPNAAEGQTRGARIDAAVASSAAVASGDVALAAKLIDASLASNGGAHASRNAAVMDRAGDIMGRTALHVAAEKGHVGMVESSSASARRRSTRAGFAGRLAHALRRGGKQGGSARCAAEERSEGHDGGERRAPSRSFPRP